MDVLGKIVGGSGCAVDGTVAAQNPLSRALDGVLQSQARGAGAGRVAQQQQQPGFARDLSAQMQRQQFAQAADAQFLQGLEQQAMQRSQMEAAFRAGEAQQAAMGRPHHAAMEAAFQDARQHQHQPFRGMPPHAHGPPPQMMMRQHLQAHEAWVDDFRGANPMDAAWQTAGKTPHEAAWEQARTPAPHMYRPQESLPQQFAPAVEQPAQAAARSAEAQQASAEMARTMSQNPDPKWQNSEFLQFMNQVSSGEVELDEEKNQVSAADGLKMEGALEGAWGDTASPEVRVNRDLYESTWKSSADTMESAFADASGVSAQSGLDAAWEAESKAAAPVMGNALDGAWGDSRTEEEKAMEGAWAGEDNLVSVCMHWVTAWVACS
jgi:hypothetical protein